MEATRLNASINETQTHFIYVIGGKNKGFVNDENEVLEKPALDTGELRTDWNCERREGKQTLKRKKMKTNLQKEERRKQKNRKGERR